MPALAIMKYGSSPLKSLNRNRPSLKWSLKTEEKETSILLKPKMKLDSILLSFMDRQVLILWPESAHLGLTKEEDFHLHQENELKCEIPSGQALLAD